MTSIPFKKRKRKCQALNRRGKRCGKKASWVGEYHGEGELYGCDADSTAVWVVVELCGQHMVGMPD